MSTFIIGLIVALCVFLAIRSILKDRRDPNRCTHNCGTCAGCHTTNLYEKYHESNK